MTRRAVARGHHHLRELRRRRRLTQREAAACVGISERTWRRYEQGQNLLAPGQLEVWVQRLEERNV